MGRTFRLIKYKKPYENTAEYPSVAQLDNATDSDSGEWGFKSLRAGQKRTPYGVSFFGLFRIRRDLKPTVKKMPHRGIFREERLWRHSYAQDATSEAESLGLYKVLRAEVTILR